MKYTLEKDLRTHHVQFDGPLDLLENTARKFAALEQMHSVPHCMRHRTAPVVEWPGRKGQGWKELRAFINQPWPEAVQMIQQVVDAVDKAVVPDLKDTRRKTRWSEDSGETDVYRAMDGEPEYMRQTFRTRVAAPPHVTLLANLDRTLYDGCNKSGVWYRSAVAIAVADKLEKLGYGVDVITYCLGGNVYPGRNNGQFVSMPVKKAGDPVDLNTLCDVMSSWFTTEAIFGSFVCADVMPESLGHAIKPDHEETDPWATPFAPWFKLLDLEQGTIAVLVPNVTGTVQDAIACTEKVIARIKAVGG